MRIVLLTVLLLALTAPAAGAATLVFTPSGCTGMPLCGPEFINLHAAAGEVNRVSSAPGGAGSIIIRDDGAVITGDCERVDDHARRCPAGLLTAYLGDGDDEVSRAGAAYGGDGADHATGVGSFFGEEGDDVGQVTVQGEGGPGNDRLEGPQLEGGPGDDRLEGTSLVGGPGEDLLTATDPTSISAGPGRDTVVGSTGDDVVYDGDIAPAADVLDGGGGRDVLSYSVRPEPVRVDIGAQTSSDGDLLSSFEGAAGGLGADILIGDAGPNWLAGDTGDDTLTGGDGNDLLRGGGGSDTFDAGAGDDRIEARSTGTNPPGYAPDGTERCTDRPGEPVACGPGADLVADVGRDVLDAGCERVTVGYLPPVRVRPLAVRGGRAAFELPRSRGTLALRSASGRERARSFSLRRRARVRVRVPAGGGPYEIGLRRRGAGALRWRVPALR